MNIVLKLNLPAGAKTARCVHEALRNLLNLIPMNEDDQFRVLLVADEAVQNAVDASDIGEMAKEIELNFSLADQCIRMVIKNAGVWKYSSKETLTRKKILKHHQPELMDERGRGLYIMAEYSQNFLIRQCEDGRIVTRLTLQCQGVERVEKNAQ